MYELEEHTMFWGADKIADSTHASVILALRLIQLNADPLPAGKLSGATETERASLQERGRVQYDGCFHSFRLTGTLFSFSLSIH